MNWPGASPREFDAEWTRQLTLSLDSDGRLVAERAVINDPPPVTTNLSPKVFDAIQAGLGVFPKRSVYVRSRSRS